MRHIGQEFGFISRDQFKLECLFLNSILDLLNFKILYFHARMRDWDVSPRLLANLVMEIRLMAGTLGMMAFAMLTPSDEFGMKVVGHYR